MKEIIRGEKWVLPYYNNNENDNIEYKLSDYIFIEKCDDGYLLLHTITWSLFLLNEFEYENILNYDYLKKWFIVLDKNINEEEIAVKAYIERSTLEEPPTFENINTFIIYTTNKCNARCSYCYNQNQINKNMTEETSINVANFIAKNSENIYIEWLGGEPLVNAKSIDKICETLKSQNIIFESKLVTNGLLLTNENIEKCKNLWNVKSIQISFDGINETYNSIKNYANKTINAFDIVISNIKNCLINSDIKFNFRINISEENLTEIENTIKYFYNTFNEWINTRIFIYGSVIFQLLNNIEVVKKIRNEMLKVKSNYPFFTFDEPTILNHKKLLYCMSEKGNALSISHNGDLCLCALCHKEHIIGHINDGITNHSLITEWNTKDGDNIEFCLKHKCKYLPICHHIKKCPNSTLCYNIEKKDYKEEDIRKNIIYTYEEYKKRINQMKNGEE